MRDGLEEVLKKLREKPCCASGYGPDFIKQIDKTTFMYRSSMSFMGSAACGMVDWGDYYRGEVQVAEIAFYQSTGCCGIEHTIVHEVTHLLGLRHKILGDSPWAPGGGVPITNAHACFPCKTT